MNGDINDVTSRLQAVIPPWFGNDDTPNLDSIIAGYASAGSTLFSQFAYEQLQTRITTATDSNLDAIAVDYYGLNGLPRNPGENDASYRNRILAYLLIERATLNGMYNILTLLTGNRPIICVPGLPLTCGGYDLAGCGYNLAGGYSSHHPSYTNYQCFIKVFTSSPIFNVGSGAAGWNVPQGAWNGAGSNLVWGSQQTRTLTTEAQLIYDVINATKPEGSTCWVAIVNETPP